MFRPHLIPDTRFVTTISFRDTTKSPIDPKITRINIKIIKIKVMSHMFEQKSYARKISMLPLVLLVVELAGQLLGEEHRTHH
jgi:hypothetical protein